MAADSAWNAETKHWRSDNVSTAERYLRDALGHYIDRTHHNELFF